MKRSLLEVDSLSVNYRAVQAVSNVSFQVEKKSVVTLLGPNGAGKSSVLKALSGIAPISSGSISFEGTEITKWSPRSRIQSGIAQVMEGRRLFGDQTVVQNLEMGAFIRFKKGRTEHSLIKKDIKRYLMRFPVLEERRNQMAKTLSGGQQQMLVFSMAMMARPNLLLLDEPSLGLAPLVVKELFEFIVEVKNSGVGVILVEQMATFALKIADYSYVLDQGKIKAEGTGEDLGRSVTSGELKKLYFS